MVSLKKTTWFHSLLKGGGNVSDAGRGHRENPGQNESSLRPS